MSPSEASGQVSQPARITSRNNGDVVLGVPDSLHEWADRYQALAVTGVRSEEVAAKIGLHLGRFRAFFIDGYGHDRIATVGRRDVVAWQHHLADDLAPSTVNTTLRRCPGSLHGCTPKHRARSRPATRPSR